MSDSGADAVIQNAARALSALLLAAAFVSEPDVWPGFVAFVERETGKEFTATQREMATAMAIADAMRTDLGRAS